MNRKNIFHLLLLGLIGSVLAACTTFSPTPTPASPTLPPTTTAIASQSTAQSSPGFERKTSSGGSVDVGVTPLLLNIGESIVFEIAMNTHSVDLRDDMTKITFLRDDAGKEYTPIAWEGSAPGGHHRTGKLKFEPLANKPKYVELVIKGLANIPERVFHWDF